MIHLVAMFWRKQSFFSVFLHVLVVGLRLKISTSHHMVEKLGPGVCVEDALANVICLEGQVTQRKISLFAHIAGKKGFALVYLGRVVLPCVQYTQCFMLHTQETQRMTGGSETWREGARVPGRPGLMSPVTRLWRVSAAHPPTGSRIFLYFSACVPDECLTSSNEYLTSSNE